MPSALLQSAEVCSAGAVRFDGAVRKEPFIPFVACEKFRAEVTRLAAVARSWLVLFSPVSPVTGAAVSGCTAVRDEFRDSLRHLASFWQSFILKL